LPAFEEVQPTIYEAVSALQDARSPDRATELFVESVAIASAARLQYHEPPLSSEELRAYLVSARGFFNSFWHE
jgi:hypothetical protein